MIRRSQSIWRFQINFKLIYILTSTTNNRMHYVIVHNVRGGTNIHQIVAIKSPNMNKSASCNHLGLNSGLVKSHFESQRCQLSENLMNSKMYLPNNYEISNSFPLIGINMFFPSMFANCGVSCWEKQKHGARISLLSLHGTRKTKLSPIIQCKS